jgi:putative NIF3 family GTP cyclohydrolase 1 type 2
MSTVRVTIAPCLALAVLLASPAGAADAGSAGSPLTARQAIERIRSRVGATAQADTVDTFKAGDPDTPITGIATTMMSTLDVLQRAAAAGANLVITHEPTFFAHRDETGGLEAEGDPVYRAKLAFIRDHKLVVWRFHDLWHQRKPDGVQEGVLAALGWEKYRTTGDPLLFVLPPTTVGALGADVKKRLGVRAMRVVGAPDQPVSRVALLPGAWGFDAHRKALQRTDVDALLIGEAQEWETIEYVVDAIAAGMRKALIVPGHVPSEQPGMDACAAWLRTFITEVPVQFVATREPWTAIP